MTADKDQLKSVAYLDQQILFVEKLLGVKFRKVGRYLYSAYCPFHKDSEPSFRVRVDHKEEVRFRCWGACRRDCDIYELIRLKRKCSFHDAVLDFAMFVGLDRIKFSIEEPPSGEASVDPEDHEAPLSFLEPPEPDPVYLAAMSDAICFYNRLLMGYPERFEKVLAYLHKRGVTNELTRDFRIGFAPGPKEPEFAGRALISDFLDRFNADYRTFRPFSEANLVRLINDDSNYRRYVEPSYKCAFRTNYLDFFAGRLVFPVHSIKGEIQGIVGRRLDNREPRWIRQKGAREASIWLYGIDKAHRAIRHYKAVILVEGIFDYFAFFSLLQNQSRPIVLATFGAHLTDDALSILAGLGVEHYVVAYDWDYAGKLGIQRAVKKLGANLHYLGGLAEGQDPADKLKGVAGAIDGFSLKYLLSASKQAQAKTAKPVQVSYIACGQPGKRNVVLSPASAMGAVPQAKPAPGADSEKKRYYSVDAFLPLLSYDNGNRASLIQKVEALRKMLDEDFIKPVGSEAQFWLYADLLKPEHLDKLGPALIMWLRILIEQQAKKRRVPEKDGLLADMLKTSRQTANKYKQMLKKLGFVQVRDWKKGRGLSVVFFPGAGLIASTILPALPLPTGDSATHGFFQG